MPKMLNSRPSVSGHKQKVAPITRFDSNLGHGNKLPQFVTDLAVNGIGLGLVLGLGLGLAIAIGNQLTVTVSWPCL